MRVLVAGGTGSVGRHVVRRLTEAGHDVRVVSRTPREGGIVADLSRGADGISAGFDAVVSALGAPVSPWPLRPFQTYDRVDRRGNLALLKDAEESGVKRFVYVSVFDDGLPDGAYVAAHRDVALAVRRSAIPSVVVRPTGFFSALNAYRQLARLGVGVVIGDGSARSNPVHDDDLAEVIAASLDGEPGTIDVGGPDVLTRREMASLAFVGLREPRVLSVPAFLPRIQAALLALLLPRVGQNVRFLIDVSTHDGIAPPVGKRRLADWFANQSID